MTALITRPLAALPPLSDDARETLAALPREAGAHDALMAGVPAMNALEAGGTGRDGVLPLPFTAAAWNLERCLFPASSAALLSETGAALVLLSEMDSGMARTAQVNTTAVVAAGLGMAYAYGVEFFELGLGQDTELRFCTEDRNALGFHGNAILAHVGLTQPFMIRLAGRRQWFTDAGDQPRMGERMAIGAVIATAAGPMVAVSTHLESNARPPDRAAQLAGVIDTVDATFPGLPVMIGGDLNTGNFPGGDWSDETLFDLARARGFAVHGGPDGQVTTRPSLITRWPDRAMRLDWFLTRGLVASGAQVVAALDPDGRPLSDHELMTLRIDALVRPAAGGDGRA